MSSRVVNSLMLVVAVATSRAALAQIAPNIQKPISTARAAAAAANERTKATDNAATQGAKKAPAAQGPTSRQIPVVERTTVTKTRVIVPVPAMRDTSITPIASVIYREVYSYSPEGRRDPFVSLMATGELRPLLADLALVSVIYDVSAPRRSVALLTDGSSGLSYRTTVGGTLGRMKVTRIGPQDITFNIEEYGLSRQQTLVIDHTPKKDASTTRRP